MSGITLQQAQEQLNAWVAANMAVTKGQEYTIGTRKLRRVDATEILNQITFWEKKVAALSGRRTGIRGMRITYGVPGR